MDRVQVEWQYYGDSDGGDRGSPEHQEAERWTWQGGGKRVYGIYVLLATTIVVAISRLSKISVSYNGTMKFLARLMVEGLNIKAVIMHWE